MSTDDEEKLAACLLALAKAHRLLSVIDRYDGEPRAITEEFVKQCREWDSTEFDPETGNVKKCAHRWKRAPLDGTMHCIKCGLYGGNSH